MKRSSLNVYRPARLVLLCLFSLATVFVSISSTPSSTPWAAEAGSSIARVDELRARSTFSVTEFWPASHAFRTNSGIENSNLPQALNRNLATLSAVNPEVPLPDSPPLLALNKIHVTNPTDPIPGPGNQPSVTWQLGVSITYVLTLTNSGGANSHVSISDTLPAGFVFVAATCTPSFSAVCPSGTQSPPSSGILTLGEFNMPNGGAIELRITGYFKTTGSQVNKAVATAKDNNGSPIPSVGTSNQTEWDVTVPPSSKLPNVKVIKTVSATSASFPAHLDYTVEVTNTTTTGVFLGGILTVRDNISAASGLTWNVNLLPCIPTGLAVCPDLPASVSSGSSQILFAYSANNSGWLPGGASYKLKFSVDVTNTATCDPPTVSFSNQAFLDFSNGLSDSISNDNTSQFLTTTITTLLNPCPVGAAGPTVSKQQIDPTSGLAISTANWNAPVKYRVTISNPTTAPVTITLFDFILKGANTPAFTATITSPPACVGCTSLSAFHPQTPTITNSGAFSSLWDATVVVPAASGNTQPAVAVVEYTVSYAPTCETDGVTDQITNRIAGGPSWQDVSTTLPEWNPCELKVDKTKLTAGPILFGQPFTYKVVYTNLSTTTAVNTFVRDVVSIKSNRYGSFLVDSSVNCSVSSGSIAPVSATPLLPFTKTLTGATVAHRPVGWRGLRLLDEYLHFGPGAVLQCQVTIKAQQPTSTNPFCQGTDDPLVTTDDAQLSNYAYMDPSNFNENSGVAPKFNSSQLADLPLCRNLIVKKIANAQKFGPGATIDYTITVQNVGDDPVSSFALTDLIPPPLAPLTPTSVSTCTPVASCTSGPTLTGNLLNVQYANLLPNNNPVSFVVQVLAPQAGGPYSNEAVGNFLPGGNFYFHGDPDFLKDGENIDVLTPTLSKSFVPVQIAPNGTSTLTFNVTNTNSDPNQSGISFSDTLPAGLEVVSVVSAGCGGTVSISTDKRTITLTGGQLINQHACSVIVKVKSTGTCGVYKNDKSNFSNVANLDVTSINQQLTVVGCQDHLPPTLTKLFDPAQIAANGTSTLSFNITNSTGDPKQTGISFSDTLPVGLQLVSVVANGCSGTPTISTDLHTFTLTGAQLVGLNSDGSGQHSCQISVKVQAGAVCGVYKNTKDNFSQVTNLDVAGINQQLEVTGCGTPANSCGVKTEEISCKTDGTGGYSYTFTVTNNTGHVVTAVLLTPKPNSGISIDPQQPKLPTGGIAVGASFTGTATISGGKPNQPACFTVTLMTQDGECCTTEVCPVLPDCCGVAKDESIECNGDGSYTYAVSIVNTGPNTIEHIYLNPPAGSTLSQTYFSVSLKPGDTFTAKVIIKGAKPGKYCFGISLHTAGMKDCCSGEHCVTLPECPIKTKQTPDR